MNNLITSWENAFEGHEKLTEKVWGDIFKKADPERHRSLEDDADCNAMTEFDLAASKFNLGSIDLSAPNSMHGDGCCANVYRLPKGTTVITRSATYEIDGPSGMVYRGNDYDEMQGIAFDLITDDRDYGTMDLGEDDEENEADTVVEIDEIFSEWKKALKREGK